jgi:hypothetical protein
LNIVFGSFILACCRSWIQWREPSCGKQSPLLTVGMSSNQFVYHFAIYVGEARIPAGVAVGQPSVIKAEQVQNRGVQVVDVDLLLDRPKAEFIGGAMHVPALDAAARQPATW